MKKVESIINIILLLMLILLPMFPFAQPQDNGYDSGDGDPDNIPADVPFDNWLFVFVAVGVGYGIKKIVAQKFERKKENNFINRVSIIKTE